MKEKSIYVGYDPKEKIAYDVCKHSIESISDLKVNRLYTKDIPEYDRDWGEPQSTDFTFSRFWVPYLNDFKGYSVYCDSDFLFLKNPISLLNAYNISKYAVMVVKHPPYIPKGELKMEGIPQHRMYRKNWASLIVFNNSHSACKQLTPDYLNNHRPGYEFHTLNWCRDSEIGAITINWNTLAGYYYLDEQDIGAIHYTDGGPWHSDYTDCEYAGLWRLEHAKLVQKNEKKG